MTQKEKALRMLRMAGKGGVTNARFAQNYMLRYGAILKSLREDGFVIETVKPEHGNVWTYILRHDTECQCKVSGPMFCPVKDRHEVLP